MAEESRRRGLGRGLSALLGDPVVAAVDQAADGEFSQAGSPLKGLRNLPIEKLQPGRYQPRRVFDQSAIDDLVESVKEKGILQPLLVRPCPDEPEMFEIIAGERRWRAAQAAHLHDVPAIVRNLSDREALEVALIENLQRQDLSPLEEAEGYRRLMDDFSHTQEELAKTVGKSRSHVANTMRLLALPDPVKHMLDDGSLTAGHARALLTSSDPVALAEQVIGKGLNVRQTEKLAQQGPEKAKSRKDGASAPVKDADLLALERDLTNILGLKVSIVLQGKGGEISVQYSTLEQLDDVLHRLSNGVHGRAAVHGD
ncbi:ParB/RepB/Spo0J family partition protein [Telmatospirillum siberiense]|uniref:Chromosome partitioning protein ParB n=1 Tax=Telmatospirillum siberiense TaxID=382514 RepID=A0A2N3PN07_9PROT|nr:ParB/RepB/Spo0J family partition protein [Telmatospirillum siberiense]PKU21779.1 chromosome partitioning protein ParB [Telmatospirillum siberiense]